MPAPDPKGSGSDVGRTRADAQVSPDRSFECWAVPPCPAEKEMWYSSFMLAGLIIEYTYDGDDAAWSQAVEGFVANVRNDPALTGKFSYIVMRKKEDPSQRVHIPRWDSEETLKHVQSQPWFGEFAAKVKEFAGDTLKTTPIAAAFDSAS